MSLGVMNKHKSLVDRIFRAYVEIPLTELPFDESDSELVRGTETSQSGQLTLNYKMVLE